LAYVVVETILEVWFEWTAFTLIEFLHKLHWTGGLIGTGMISAHWLYFLSGLLGLIAEWLEGDDDLVENNRKSFANSRSTSIKFLSGESTLERLKSFRQVTLTNDSDTDGRNEGKKWCGSGDSLDGDSFTQV